ncbi:hypothetical protein SAMN05660649_03137 [Desulfotomaculum arcticum]|uniref:Uncharacterized protein n=1 Tax=Desulfotruncus arcticus DSM 17038 TaxID=1121424 RepID=A0A1I2VX03_9FIRM|nr:hypothetical protein [Desulfotruncus arcticus]SFG92276.1 hypothetical protein SAMN05660649_03137 [Desulfotomaculum arcticum] [Desulfotruncus arcticus DSM 17038]
MGLNVYRIDTGIVGKIFGIIRQTELPVMSLQKCFGFSHGSIILSIVDLVSSDNHYVIKDQDELERFENPLNNSWIQKSQYYIRHPKKARERYLIEAEKFHEYIYREQISDIVSFLRGNLTLKHLTISSEEGIDFSAFANIPIEDLKVEGKADVKLKSKKELVINCPEGLKISEKRKEYIWINDFQDLLSVVDGFQGGEFRHTIEISNSFGMGLKEAKQIGVGTSWLRKCKFEIKFTC